MQKKILVVEDNAELSDLLTLHLSDQSWLVDLARDGLTGYKKATTGEYDLIVLDIMLPGMDGIDILKNIRSRGLVAPVLMLTSKSSEIDRILGLELGADDYITKPFSIREFVARIKAVFRRMENLSAMKKTVSEPVIQAGGLVIDPEKRKVTVAGQPVELTAKEYDLLTFFARHPGRVFNRSQLLESVWGYGHDGYDHTVNSNINRLRAKIETDPANPQYVLTVWGVGYKFTDTDGADA
ncbi:response regulator transcription factor [uncultured Desulfobacter sp.]|uniref:response regulator transcription factor n=1 Tax=uncultured Desulfobacter sp. TaxID=240139 RepID=UPI002AAA79CC|nr:response regulator transcription factor [uncultured Desulfobacter sp.]